MPFRIATNFVPCATFSAPKNAALENVANSHILFFYQIRYLSVSKNERSPECYIFCICRGNKIENSTFYTVTESCEKSTEFVESVRCLDLSDFVKGRNCSISISIATFFSSTATISSSSATFFRLAPYDCYIF